MIDFQVFRRHAFLLLAAGTLIGARPGFAQAVQQQEATPRNPPVTAGEQPRQRPPPPKLSAEQQAMLREAERLNAQVEELREAGRVAEALPLATRALRIREQVLGKEHWSCATSLYNLAALYRSMGAYAKAEPLYVQDLDLRKKVLGEENPHYAVCLDNLALLYCSMGEYAKAEPLLVQARDIFKKVRGEGSPDYGTNLNNLAALYKDMGEYAQAEPLYLQSRDIRKKALGEESPEYATSLNNLALLYSSMGQYAKAEPLYVQALGICKKVLGEEHPLYATSLNNLAGLYQVMGAYAKAEPLYAQARDIDKNALGEESPSYATSLNNLAVLYYHMGAYAKAESFCLEATQIRVSLANRILPTLSEARAMAFAEKLRGNGLLLMLQRQLETPLAEVYDMVWRTRAPVTQMLAKRRRLVVDSPELRGLLDNLRDTGQQLAQLTLAETQPQQRQARRERLVELNDEKERLEAELGRQSEAFRRELQIHDAGFDDLAALLDEKTAVVDIIATPMRCSRMKMIFSRMIGKKTVTEPHYEAFVLKPSPDEPGYTVDWVHLGPTKPIDEAVDRWRAELTGQTASQTTSSTPPEHFLRQRIWDKIEPSLAGCSSVTVIPAGVLSFVPWAALPGRRARSYLLEDYALSTAQSGQQLYACLTAPQGESDRMLLVGGVAHDSRPSEPTPSTDLLVAAERTRGPAMTDRWQWDFLTGSREEVEAIETLCDDSIEPLLLQGVAADEAALRRDMPGSRYVHLATHGFFADAKFRSMFGHDVGGEDLFGDMMRLDSDAGSLGTRRRAGVTTRNPLILSGVVLAGANLPPKTDELGLPTGEDGILTAEEIVGLDLRDTDLVVLSACDTGLGDVAGGEGVMGLQRAFHLAGARTVVASLWKVEDNATRVLMTEFYRNLWEKKMGKLDALRAAQLTMIDRYDPKSRQLRGAGPRVTVDPDKLANSQLVGPRRDDALPPFYWAAFTLSGQCRPTSLPGD